MNFQLVPTARYSTLSNSPQSREMLPITMLVNTTPLARRSSISSCNEFQNWLVSAQFSRLLGFPQLVGGTGSGSPSLLTENRSQLWQAVQAGILHYPVPQASTAVIEPYNFIHTTLEHSLHAMRPSTTPVIETSRLNALPIPT